MDRKKHDEDEEDTALMGAPMPNMLADEDDDPMEDNSLPIDVEDEE